MSSAFLPGGFTGSVVGRCPRCNGAASRVVIVVGRERRETVECTRGIGFDGCGWVGTEREVERGPHPAEAVLRIASGELDHAEHAIAAARLDDAAEALGRADFAAGTLLEVRDATTAALTSRRARVRQRLGDALRLQARMLAEFRRRAEAPEPAGPER